MFSGQTLPPAEGARFDVYFEGPVTGKLKGTVKGVDYLHIRADGRCQLNIHAEITTEDGRKVALAANGVAIPQEGSPLFQLKENVTLTSNHPEYSWVNPIQVWAPGTVDVSKEKSGSRHTPSDRSAPQGTPRSWRQTECRLLREVRQPTVVRVPDRAFRR